MASKRTNKKLIKKGEIPLPFRLKGVEKEITGSEYKELFKQGFSNFINAPGSTLNYKQEGKQLVI